MIIYSHPKCIACQELKAYLNKTKIGYSEINVAKLSPKEQMELQQKTGVLSLPIIEYKDKYYYSLKELKEAL